MMFHSNNHTRTSLATGTGVIDNAVNSPIEGLKIAGNVTSISIKGINVMDIPYEYTFTQSANITSKVKLKANTEYVFYCEERTTTGSAGVVLSVVIDGKGDSINDKVTTHAFSAKTPIKFTPTSDNPNVQLYANGWDYNGSAGHTATVKGIRIYEGKYSPFVHQYQADQVIKIPYTLAEEDSIVYENGIVTLTQNNISQDITDTDTGKAIMSLQTYYPQTTVTGCEITYKSLG